MLTSLQRRSNPEMFQATRRRLALWYTAVTAILLLLFASGFYLYVRHTLVERIDDTLNHVVEVVQRSLILEPIDQDAAIYSKAVNQGLRPVQVNIDASFPRNAEGVEDDRIDLEWFSPAGDLLWSTFSAPLALPLRISDGETVYVRLVAPPTTDPMLLSSPLALRQVTKQVNFKQQVLGYLRVSHPWFEVTKPSRQLIWDLSLGTALMVGAVAAIGWLLSGLAIAPVRDSYQRLKQFTADASHELRNPIAVIQTNVQVALADPDPQLQQDQLQVVERLTRRLGRLVDDLLFLARQDSGMIPLRLVPVTLSELLAEVVEEQQSIAIDKRLTLTMGSENSQAASDASDAAYTLSAYTQSAYTLSADRDQLTRLFTNLIGNAVQYTPQNGKIEVSLNRIKHQGNFCLQVKVHNTGIGIPADSIPHLFDRFYRVDPARSNSDPQNRHKAELTSGSGLGLAIAKVIVENHQGQIQVESPPSQGTTFTVILPVHRPE